MPLPYTKEAKAWIHHATCAAGHAGVYAISPEHFLLALLREGGDDPALALLKRLGVDTEALHVSVEEQIERIRSGHQTWPPRPKAEGYAESIPAPPSIPINTETLRQFALDAYSMHLIGLVRLEAGRRHEEEISTISLLLALIWQDQIRLDEPMAIRLFAGTEITMQSVREAVARLEGDEPVLPAPQKSNVWSRIFGRQKSSSEQNL